MTNLPEHCTCPHVCPDCGLGHAARTICHDHRIAVHGTACDG